MTKMPVYFLSHGGGPWPYIDSIRAQYRKTEHEFRVLPDRLPSKPKAILVISGHWEAAEFTVTTSQTPPMVYDYSGFPPHTYQIQYPAPGSPELAAHIKKLLENKGFSSAESSSQGFDHGVFVPLALMYPEADIPVVMLSLKSTYDPLEHFQVGQALSSLRENGVLIIGSGLTYHNMRGFGRPESTPIAETFEHYLSAAITNADVEIRNERLIHWQQAPAARQAHPREDHLLPLMVIAGAAESDIGQTIFIDYVMEVPMASYEFGGIR